MVEINYFEYLEDRWLSIPYEFRIAILIFNLLVIVLCLLYIYFFKNSFKRSFCCMSNQKIEICIGEDEIKDASQFRETKIQSSIIPLKKSISINFKRSQSKKSKLETDNLIENINKYKNSLKSNINLIKSLTKNKVLPERVFIKKELLPQPKSLKQEALSYEPVIIKKEEFSDHFEAKKTETNDSDVKIEVKESAIQPEIHFRVIKVEPPSEHVFKLIKLKDDFKKIGPKKFEFNSKIKADQHQVSVGFSNILADNDEIKEVNKKSEHEFSTF